MIPHWRDYFAQSVYGTPEAGAIVVLEYKAWRVIEVRPHDEHTVGVIVRPVGAEFDFATFNRSIRAGRLAPWRFLPEHYVVCAKCGEIPPCREVEAERTAHEAAKTFDRYEMAGVCPACREVVTSRQQQIVFPENHIVPLGPPVTFHLRNKCLSTAIRYEDRWVALTGGTPRLSCQGRLTRHADKFVECDSSVCPGVGARHGSYAVCAARPGECLSLSCTTFQADARSTHPATGGTA